MHEKSTSETRRRSRDREKRVENPCSHGLCKCITRGGYIRSRRERRRCVTSNELHSTDADERTSGSEWIIRTRCRRPNECGPNAECGLARSSVGRVHTDVDVRFVWVCVGGRSVVLGGVVLTGPAPVLVRNSDSSGEQSYEAELAGRARAPSECESANHT